jgi:hypothetical protein
MEREYHQELKGLRTKCGGSYLSDCSSANPHQTATGVRLSSSGEGRGYQINRSNSNKEYKVSCSCNRSMAAKFVVQQYEIGVVLVDNVD